MSDAIPFDSLAADPDPDPNRAIRRWDRKTHAAGAPDPDPDPGPASGAPLQPLLYLLSKLLHAPHSRF